MNNLFKSKQIAGVSSGEDMHQGGIFQEWFDENFTRKSLHGKNHVIANDSRSQSREAKKPLTFEECSNDRSMEEIAQLFDPTFTPLKLQKPEGRPKSIYDVRNNIYRDFGSLSSEHFANLPLGLISGAGELLEYGGQKFAYALNHIDGGLETLELVAKPFGLLTDGVKDFVKDGAENCFLSGFYKKVGNYYDELPHGAKVIGSFGTDIGILSGAGRLLNIGLGGISGIKKPNIFSVGDGKIIELENLSNVNKFEHKLPSVLFEKVPTWNNWKDIEKVILDNREYARYGDMLYTRHALENTYPSSLGRVVGHTSNHPPVGIPPSFIKMIIESPETKVSEKCVDGIARKLYETESLRVVTENDIVVTIVKKK